MIADLHMSRRRFIKQGLLVSAALSMSGCSVLRFQPKDVPPLEEVPDFSEANIIKHVVGLRPYRKKKIRLEIRESGQKVLVYNYGHGGGGFTTSWGCAEIAGDMIDSVALPRPPVAVLGGGVIGLSAARIIQEKGFPVRIYAAAFTPNVTSNLAGAQWAPSGIALGETCEERGMFDDILARSYRRFTRLDGIRYGISHRLNYVSEEGYGGALDRVPQGILPSFDYLGRLPFPGAPHRGKVYRTLLIEPPIYMPALMDDVRNAGGTFVERRFSSEEEIMGLPERIVVNCLGLGAGEVCRDELVMPIRGQLVHLKPKKLPYLLIHDGYVFPRADAIVVGGSYDKGMTDTNPDPALAIRILERNRSFFWGSAKLSGATQPVNKS